MNLQKQIQRQSIFPDCVKTVQDVRNALLKVRFSPLCRTQQGAATAEHWVRKDRRVILHFNEEKPTALYYAVCTGKKSPKILITNSR